MFSFVLLLLGVHLVESRFDSHMKETWIYPLTWQDVRRGIKLQWIKKAGQSPCLYICFYKFDLQNMPGNSGQTSCLKLSHTKCHSRMPNSLSIYIFLWMYVTIKLYKACTNTEHSVIYNVNISSSEIRLSLVSVDDRCYTTRDMYMAVSAGRYQIWCPWKDRISIKTHILYSTCFID